MDELVRVFHTQPTAKRRVRDSQPTPDDVPSKATVTAKEIVTIATPGVERLRNNRAEYKGPVKPDERLRTGDSWIVSILVNSL